MDGELMNIQEHLFKHKAVPTDLVTADVATYVLYLDNMDRNWHVVALLVLLYSFDSWKALLVGSIGLHDKELKAVFSFTPAV